MDPLFRICVIASAAGFAFLFGCSRTDQDERAILREPANEEAPAGLGQEPQRDTANDVALAPRATEPASPVTVARAELAPTAGNDVGGTVTFVDDGDALVINVALTGLTPGAHGMHVHEFGDCTAPDAASAGEHLNPRNAPHGGPTSGRDARHPGDLGNVVADADGNARTTIRDTVLGSEPDFEFVGRALIVHASADDLASQPSGNSGDPVACGVIEPAAADAANGGHPVRSPG